MGPSESIQMAGQRLPVGTSAAPVLPVVDSEMLLGERCQA